MCIYLFLNYLHDEMNLIFHLKNFRNRSVLLKQHGLEPDVLIARLQSQLTNSLTGILHDMVRQKMVNILIETLHNVPVSIQDLMGVSKPPPVLCKLTDNYFSSSAFFSDSASSGGTGKSFSEAFIFASTNLQYDKILFIELPWKLQAQKIGRTWANVLCLLFSW